MNDEVPITLNNDPNQLAAWLTPVQGMKDMNPKLLAGCVIAPIVLPGKDGTPVIIGWSLFDGSLYRRPELQS